MSYADTIQEYEKAQAIENENLEWAVCQIERWRAEAERWKQKFEVLQMVHA